MTIAPANSLTYTAALAGLPADASPTGLRAWLSAVAGWASGAWPGSAAALLGHLFSIVLVVVLAIALERALVHALRALMLLAKPMIGGQEASGRLWRYERSLFTPGSSNSRIVMAGLVMAGLFGWLGWRGPAALTWLAALALLAALAWDLWTWECVMVSQWQLAWRRGWVHSVRRLPLIQVADVHVVERRASLLRWAWLAQRLGRPLGTCYLAIELHNGKALKLPRTGLQSGLPAVEQVARYLQRHLRVVERERRLAVRQQLRAMRHAAQLAPDADELALRRELGLLRVKALKPQRGSSAGLAAHRLAID